MQLVTLVVPVFNMEQYLPRCMDSLLSQTCLDYEIVLVDDGSTDSSGALCDSYAARDPERIRVIHKPNEGLSSARNAGIDAARGEFIVFPDPDDWAEPDYVEKLSAYQREYQADLVCLGHYVDTETASVPARADQDAILLNGTEAQRGLLLPPEMHGFSWNKLYRVDIIRDHGLRFPDGMGTTEDLYFAYRYLAHCQCVFHSSDTRIYHYCQREDSATHSCFSADKMGTIKTFDYIIGDCSQRDPELADCAASKLCTAAVNLIWLCECAEHRDLEARRYLLGYIRRLLPRYLISSCYGPGRKIQAVLAAISPRLYMHLKNTVRRS